ncbi:TonB-dependent siderophore receptor [Olivibacter jilunii]|uniref:TonB-dependent siderophore receptor n=1 Tax=Olivibacter jilunii TaxID=985016 RepID=UPI003F14FC16
MKDTRTVLRNLVTFIMLTGFSVGAYAQEGLQKSLPDSLRSDLNLQEVVIQGYARKMKVDSLSSTLKIDVPLLQLPQQVTTVSAELLREQGILELKDAVRNTAGVYFGLNNNVFDGSSNLYMRGFAQNSIYRNGLPSGDNRSVQTDEAIIESIEFIKGAAGFLNSSGEAGGRINIITKVPRDEAMLKANIQGGSFGLFRAAIDVGSAVKEKGFSYRFNEAFTRQGYYRDFMKGNKIILAHVLQYNFSKRTSLLGELIINNGTSRNATLTRVTPFDEIFKDRLRSNIGGDPGMPKSWANEQTARLVFTHAFNDRWKITSQSSFKNNPSEIWSMLGSDYNTVSFDSTGFTERRSFRTDMKARVWATQFFVNGRFNTGKSIEHRLMAGGEYFSTTDSTYQIFGENAFPLYRDNQQYGLNTDQLRVMQETPYNYFQTDNKWLAFYLYDAINFNDRLILTLGGRYTHNSRDARTFYSPANANLKQGAFTPRAGLTYMVDPRTSAFFLYDQTFVPTSGQDRLGNVFKPIRGNDMELGLKRNWFDGLLATSLTGFIIERNNMTAQDPEDTKFSLQLGEVRSKGFEVEAIGSISPYVALSANYGFADVKVTEDTRTQKAGSRYQSAPQQTVNTWFRYSFPPHIFSGFSINVGSTSIIKRGTTTADVFLPDFTKFDAGIAYNRGKVTTRFMLDNITNKRYIAAGDIYGGRGYYTEGAPLNARMSVTILL